MKNIYILSFLLLPLLGITQNREEQYETAKKQIKELKEGVLLVRLHTKQPVINALEEKGATKKANYIKEKQETENKEIVAAFKNFDFCPVYFFYSQFSDSLKNGKYNNVIILNDSLQPTKLNLTNYYIADFGNVEKNYVNDTTDVKRNELKAKGIDTKKKYKGGSNLSIRAMIISDANFNQLKSPFPFYTRFHPTPFHNLTYEEVVKKMEERLNGFY
jgi:hypothetical protein